MQNLPSAEVPEDNTLLYMKTYLLIALLVVLLLPFGASAAATTTEWSYVRPAVDKNFGSEVHARQPYENEDIQKVYLVRNNRLYEDKKWRFNENTGEAEDVDFGWTRNKQTEEYKIWNIFASFAGKDFIKKNVLAYITFRDPDDGTLGVVWRADTREPSWFLGLNVNAADFGNQKWERDMVITLLHEYGHLLTMNKSQIKYIKKKEYTCATGMSKTKFGCALKKSYMSAYMTDFWSTEDIAHAASVRSLSGKKARAAVKKYFKAHPDDFVSQYAANGPEEDVAESFTDFILQAKPLTEIKEKDRKMLFFYRYPELVTLRTTMRSKIAPYFK